MPKSETGPLACSVIIEWENALLSDHRRADEMLRVLRRQLAEQGNRLAGGAEVLILYDPAEVDARGIAAAVGLDGDWTAEVRIEPVSGLRYYEFKNHGFTLARGEILVLMDSDAVPEAGWLGALLAAFDDAAVQVVCGTTYMVLDDFYSRAMAGFWFFPPREEQDGVGLTDDFFANNVAFRRAVVEAHPFPSAPTFRGQCTMLARELTAAGIPIHQQKSARAHHPPPNGLRHFINRAVCMGHDRCQHSRLRGQGMTFPLAALFRFLTFPLLGGKRIPVRARRIRLGVAGVSGALAVGVVYEALVLIGSLVSLFAAPWVRRNFNI